MAHLSYRLSLVILLATASLTFGASLLTNSSPAQTPAPATDSGGSAGAGDGFQLTVKSFQMRANKAREIIAILTRINVEAKEQFPGNLTKQQAYLATKLNELYPGSTFDGVRGKVLFQKNFVATFTGSLNVDSIVELGDVTVTYLLEQGQILISYGVNSVTAVIDRATPSRSVFTKVVIPAMKGEAENILTIPGYRRTTADSVETSILNDAYQLLSQTNNLRMDYFAADIMRSANAQKNALSIAGSGYFDRHPKEYQKGAEQVAATSKAPDGSTSTTFGTLFAFTGRLVLIVLIALGIFWGFGRTVRAIRMFFMGKIAKLYVKKYHELSPMVIQSLHQVGRSLWGRNSLWSRKYYVTKRSDRWVLSDGKIDRSNPHNLPDNLLEVCLKDDCFKIRITRLRRTSTSLAVTSKGYSRQELDEHLRQLSSAFSLADTASGDTAAAPAGEISSL